MIVERVMKISSVLVLIFLFALMNLVGCSSSNSNPVVPVNENSSLDLPLAQQNKTASDHQILGEFIATFDIETLKVSVVQNRTLNAHHNVTGRIPGPEITINNWDPISEIIDVDIELHNPTWTTVYDVRLIIYTDDAGHSLVNEDNWTSLWDIPGGETANPFKAYAKDVSDRSYAALLWEQENFKIKCPNSNFTVRFLVDACYPGNCDEPYEISNFQQTSLLADVGSTATLHVDIFDWQDEMSDVVIAVPQITGVAYTVFSHDSGNKWKTQIRNNNGADIGSYPCLIQATSLNSPGIAIYDYVTVEISNLEGWAVNGGGSFRDELNGCTLDNEGNVYVTGTAQWDNVQDPKVIILNKYSRDGVRQWGHLFYCDSWAAGYSVVCDNSNNVYFVGYFSETVDFDPGPDVVEMTANDFDAFLCKYDPKGNLIWGVNWDGNSREVAYDIAFNGLDELSVACWESDCVAFRYFNLDGAPTGNILLNGSGWDAAKGIAYDSLNNTYVTGSFTGELDFDAGPGEDKHVSHQYCDAFIMKYDSSRNFQWAQTWGARYWDMGNDVDVDSQGNVYVAGAFSDDCDFDPGPGEDVRTSEGNQDAYLVKYHSDGTYDWALTWGGYDYMYPDGAYSVSVDRNDNIYVAGSFAGSDTDLDPGSGQDLHDSRGFLDVYLSKFNNDGDFQWAQTLSGQKTDKGKGVFCGPNFTVYLVGSFIRSVDFDPGPPVDYRYAVGEEDAFLVEYNSDGLWD